MNELIYVSGDDIVSLTSDVFTVQTAPKVRSYEWSYELGRRNIYIPNRDARTVDVSFTATREELERLRHIADRDMYAESPGTLVAQDEWKQSAYITGIEVGNVTHHHIYGNMKVLLLDGYWSKTVVRSYTRGSSGGGTILNGLDYPHDYKYDYTYNKTGRIIDTDSVIPCDFKMTIFGACINPSIIIGKNSYQVNTTVPAGAILVIDSRSKTVVLRDEAGYEQNMFDKAIRGDGKGKGEYIFEPIPAGESNLTWDNSFGFDIEFYITESEPPWTESY